MAVPTASLYHSRKDSAKVMEQGTYLGTGITGLGRRLASYILHKSQQKDEGDPKLMPEHDQKNYMSLNTLAPQRPMAPKTKQTGKRRSKPALTSETRRRF